MPQSARRILVVLDDIGPGDALRSTFALAAVRQANPGARITLLVSEAAAQVFEHGSGYDRLVLSRLYRAGLRGRWRSRIHKFVEVLRLLRAAGPSHDLVLILNWGTLTLDVLGRLAGRRVAGYENGLRFLLSNRLGRYDVEGDAVEQNWSLLTAAGVPRIGLAGDPHVARASWPEVTGPYAVLHTGSDWACQQWTQDSWAELADKIADEYGFKIVFTGLAGETAYVSSIQALMSRRSISFVGRTSVGELRDLLMHASLCVSVDSAPYELAQLVGTPVVVVAGPSSARPQMGGPTRPIVVNRTPSDLGLRIRDCQRSHAEGHCHDYLCPFSQLPFINVDEVMRAVGRLEMAQPTVAAR
jgi:ADP-heptose:LPS heptosyltransferase